jgi:tRNA 2-thiocytidine biosynthesis protein TtcA
MGRAIADFRMLEEGDRVMCAVSGGKDSYAIHDLLIDSLASRARELHGDRGEHRSGPPGLSRARARDYMARRGTSSDGREDTYSIVTDKIPEGKTYCSLCSRLRRGILYRLATELGCTKIALGHHRDDALATLMLNLVFAGQLKAMPPKLISDDGAHVVIRPLIYCAEATSPPSPRGGASRSSRAISAARRRTSSASR